MEAPVIESKVPAWRAAFTRFLAEHPAAQFGAQSRRDAFERFEAHGLPTRRHEYWRYTPLRALDPDQALASKGGDPFAAVDGYRLVFVDGVMDASRSDHLALGAAIDVADGSKDCSWVDIVAEDARAHTAVERPFAELNRALCSHGLAARIPAGVKLDKPILLRYEGAQPAHLRVGLLVEDGAEVTVLESGAGALTMLIEARVGSGASLHHLRAQTELVDRQFASLFARVLEGGHFASFTLAADAALIRNETMLDLTGDEARGHVAGGVLGRAGSVIDNTVFVTHAALKGESRQVFKNVLDEDGRGVFQGKILVRKGAQKTDGYQISQSILLDERAEFDAKPELEIYADDVACSHGSTSGAIDETALFYLRSRGVDRRTAESLLVAAFIEEAIAEIADEDLQEVMRGEVARWMTERAG
ncbi:MAG: SufD family Fe-S cluster assembly protein [Neomegalonema sp.]|nr:SufD family Fe-S cluster assembly protein [Neomegalonema sp.]